MIKRLSLVLALVLVAGITMAAYAEVQNVKVSGDLTTYGVARNFTFRDNKYGNDGWSNSVVGITGVNVSADLTDNVSTMVRLVNERYWGGVTGDTNNNEILLSQAYVSLKEFLYSPLTVTVGRQALAFGNQMIIGDVDTNNATSASSVLGNAAGRDADLSDLKAFDAVRATLNLEPVVIDAIAAKVSEGAALNRNDDQNLFGLNANFTINKMATVEGYWFEKSTNNKLAGRQEKQDRVDTIGAHAALMPLDILTLSGEAAYQFGKYLPAANYLAGTRGVDRSAWGLETYATLQLKDVKMSPVATVGYAYFSGNENDINVSRDETYRAWDPMFENQKFGDIMNAIMPQTNAHILCAQGTIKPLSDIALKAEAYWFWLAKRYQSAATTITDSRGDNIIVGDKKYVGAEVDISATYDYTEDVQFGLLAGGLFTGDTFSERNDNMASELIGTMKVTF